MSKDFTYVGVAEMASSGRSIRFLLRGPAEGISAEYIYVSIKDLEEVLNGHKKAATLWKPKNPSTH